MNVEITFDAQFLFPELFPFVFRVLFNSTDLSLLPFKISTTVICGGVAAGFILQELPLNLQSIPLLVWVVLLLFMLFQEQVV